MAKKREEDALDNAYDVAYRKIVIRDGGNFLQKHTVREVAKEAIRIYRKESIIQIEKEIAGEIKDFEQDVQNQLDQWSTAAKVATGNDATLPDGVKFATCKNDEATFIIEHKPQVRSILTGNRGHNLVTRRVAFPYLIFGIHFTNGRYSNMTISVRNSSLTSQEDELFHLKISNIYKDPWQIGLCMNYNKEYGKDSLDEIVSSAISQFWQTSFYSTDSMAENGNGSKSNKLRSFESWEAETKKDPSFILKINWGQIQGGKNVKDLIKYFRKNSHNTTNTRHAAFRPLGVKLAGKVRKHVMSTVAPEDYESEYIKEEKAEQERQLEAKKKFDEKTRELAKARLAKDLDNPMFRKKVEIGKGRKQCPHCANVIGSRTKICACGYDFKTKVNLKAEKENDAQEKINQMLAGIKPKPQPPRRKPRRRAEAYGNPIPDRVKIKPPTKKDKARLKERFEEIKEINRIEAEKAKAERVEEIKGIEAEKAKAKVKPAKKKAKLKLPNKVGKGKKACPACGSVVGSRSRYCNAVKVGIDGWPDDCGYKFY